MKSVLLKATDPWGEPFRLTRIKDPTVVEAVFLELPTRCAWIGFTKKQARKIAGVLLEYAQEGGSTDEKPRRKRPA